MLAVVVDTSTPAVTAALVGIARGGAPDPGGPPQVELLAERVVVDGRAHGELLAPAIDAVLAGGGARPSDLAAIVAGVGPGPFTGLRVGVVTAAAMAQALSIPAYGVCSLDGIGARTEGLCLVATDARRKELYWAVYDQGRRVTGPAVSKPSDIAAALAGLGLAPGMAAGDGAWRYAAALGLPVPEQPRYPAATALAETAAHLVLAGAAAEPLVPLYLRRPDAVEPGARKPVNR